MMAGKKPQIAFWEAGSGVCRMGRWAKAMKGQGGRRGGSDSSDGSCERVMKGGR